MPILHKLVAICEGCDARHEYEAIVNHTGEGEYHTFGPEGFGRSVLTARDVKHEPELPDGFSYVNFAADTKLLCGQCQRASATEQRL